MQYPLALSLVLLSLALPPGADSPCVRKMPPSDGEKKLEKAFNRPVRVCEKKIPVEQLDPSRSWRQHDRARVQQLIAVYGPQREWGVTLLSNIKVLEECNPTGHHYVDDGASSVLALCDLKADWENDNDAMPNGGEAWDYALVEVFMDGVNVTVHKYEDPSPEARALHMSQVHSLENNTFRATTPSTILDVGMHALASCSNKRDEAVAFICKHQGKSSKYRACQWVDFASALRDSKFKEVRDKIKDMPGLPSSFVVGNPSFCALGVKVLTCYHT